mmetsp:Transcript_23078/g.62637  ORF Transcript_23078/g.62637 Transcript_23078/m.62637 type:complete len:254 (+) Transcript_23078:392-1153(+)
MCPEARTGAATVVGSQETCILEVRSTTTPQASVRTRTLEPASGTVSNDLQLRDNAIDLWELAGEQLGVDRNAVGEHLEGARGDELARDHVHPHGREKGGALILAEQGGHGCRQHIVSSKEGHNCHKEAHRQHLGQRLHDLARGHDGAVEASVWKLAPQDRAELLEHLAVASGRAVAHLQVKRALLCEVARCCIRLLQQRERLGVRASVALLTACAEHGIQVCLGQACPEIRRAARGGREQETSSRPQHRLSSL